MLLQIKVELRKEDKKSEERRKTKDIFEVGKGFQMHIDSSAAAVANELFGPFTIANILSL